MLRKGRDLVSDNGVYQDLEVFRGDWSKLCLIWRADGRTQAAEFLTQRGAKRVRGDEAQHMKALSDQVRDEIMKESR
jgi:hypothetical protein